MLEQYRNKKIGILGFGIEGRATFEFLKSKGIESSIIDKSGDVEFRGINPDIDINTELILGEDYLKSLNNFDIIFKTPGISPMLPEIIKAIDAGVVFTSQIELFFDLCSSKIIGVTGTKGKGTTSTLIYEILKNSNIDVYLGGNIGVPAISFLEKLSSSSVVVLELSSFQLQVLKKSPNVAVVLNITSEHLDYHKDTAEYRAAKKNIVAFQKGDDIVVINDDYKVLRSFAEATPAKKYFVSKEHETNGCYVNEKDEIILLGDKIGEFKKLQLRGRHNLENVTAAAMAAYEVGASKEIISQTIESFKGLEHRLELVCEIGGVKFYNDSFSTVPETAIAAINSFTEPKIIILGGSYKGSDYTELGKMIAEANVKAIILIGDMAKEIEQAIPENFGGKKVLGLKDMTQMVETAFGLANDGDVVLLSPACASFGLFKNYKDRGNQFKEAVINLK